MSLPENSLLSPCSDIPGVYFRLTPEALDSILASNGKGVKLRMGPKIELQIGNQSFATSSIAEPAHIDLYKQNGSKFDCVGKIGHRVSVQRTNDSGSTKRLKSQNESLLQEKESKKATLLEASQIKRSSSARTPPYTHLTAAAGAGGGAAAASAATNGIRLEDRTPRSTPASPSLAVNGTTNNTSSSKKSSTSSSALLSSQKPLSQQSLTSAPVRVVHLLALGGNTNPKVLAQRTGLPLSETESILNQYATKKTDGNFKLSDQTWKDIRVWDWKHYSSQERQQVIKDAELAFDRLKLPADHAARKNLIDPKLSSSSKREKSPSTSSSSSSANSSPKKNSSPKLSSAGKPLQQPQQPQSHPSSTLTGAGTKRKAASLLSDGASTTPSAKRMSLNGSGGGGGGGGGSGGAPSEDLFELAKKFKRTYSEYAKLYSVLSAEQNRKKNKAEVAKLLQMHRELESWKKKIWDMTPPAKRTTT